MDIFNIIGSKTRRKILTRLSCHECYLSSMSEGFEISHTAISKHLSKLEDEDIIEPDKGEKDMKKIFYKIKKSKLVTSTITPNLTDFKEYDIPVKENSVKQKSLDDDVKEFKQISKSIKENYEEIADLEGKRNILMSRIKKKFSVNKNKDSPEMRILHYLLLKGQCTYEELSHYMNTNEQNIERYVEELNKEIPLKTEDEYIEIGQ